MFSLAFLMIRNESDREYVKDLYIKYEQAMFKIAYNILHNKTDAEDAVQNTFIKIIDNLEKIRAIDSNETRLFLAIITKNAAKDIQRKANHLPESVEELGELEADISVEDSVMIKIDLERFKTAMRSLPKHEHDILFMNLITGYSPAEIAGFYGISSNTARQRIFRAKRHLKQLLEEEEVNQ